MPSRLALAGTCVILELGVAATLASCGATTGLEAVLGGGGSGGGGVDSGTNDDAMAPDGDAVPHGDELPDSQTDTSSLEGGAGDARREPYCPIYLVDDYEVLSSFDPRTNAFTTIGTLGCSDPSSVLFGLSTDRDGSAYAVYYNGRVYKVDVKTGGCRRTRYVSKPDSDYVQFGSAFVSWENAGDGGGSTSETLYVASITTPTRLGILDVPKSTLTPTFELGPEKIVGVALTGTSDGRLFGFYNYTPDNTTIYTGGIVQIDPSSGNILTDAPVKVVQGQSWGFAFWGGVFYLFTTPDDIQTVVHTFDPTSGALTFVTKAPPGSLIKAASVATCAPLR